MLLGLCRRPARMVGILLLAALLASCASPPQDDSLPATVAVDANVVGPTIPSDFLGLSYEAPELANPQFDASNTHLVQALQQLGPGVLRFGGNAVEQTYWLAAPPQPSSAQGQKPAVQAVITKADLARVFAFAQRTGWKVILGVNLHNGTPEQAADEAATASSIAGPILQAIEIGNEPDLYKPAWTYPQFLANYRRFATAIRARVPDAPLVGPDSSWSHWVIPFIGDDTFNVKLLTYHYYPLHHSATLAATDPAYPSIAHLLDPKMLAEGKFDVRKNAAAAAKAHTPLRIDETNSASGGGQDGVSNVFAAALWTVDYLFTVAEEGASGVNFHGGLNTRCMAYYTPLCVKEATGDDTRYRAMPDFYGMLLFHQAAVGHTVQATPSGSDALRAHATRDDSGVLRVLLINTGQTIPLRVDVRTGAGYRQFSTLALQGSALDSADGLALGGQAVQDTGAWSGAASDAQAVSGNDTVVQVPAGSAVLATFAP